MTDAESEDGDLHRRGFIQSGGGAGLEDGGFAQRAFQPGGQKLVRDEESREMFERLNESYADGLDEEEKEMLDRMWKYHVRLLDETGNEWRTEE